MSPSGFLRGGSPRPPSPSFDVQTGASSSAASAFRQTWSSQNCRPRTAWGAPVLSGGATAADSGTPRWALLPTLCGPARAAARESHVQPDGRRFALPSACGTPEENAGLASVF